MKHPSGKTTSVALSPVLAALCAASAYAQAVDRTVPPIA